MADEKGPTIEDLQAEQDKLQAAHDKAQKSFHSARSKYAKAKEGLTQFNAKYGRMLKLVVINEEATAEAEEPETAEGDVDTTNEE